MRLIRRVLLLSLVGMGGVMLFNHWSESGWPARPSAASLDAGAARRQAARIANRAAGEANAAASRLGDTMSEGALTAKIKSKMALDDHVKARAINVDTSAAVVTLTGVVASSAERERALQLARDTEGVTRVVDRLQVRAR